MRLILSREASADLRRLRAFLNEENPAAARRAAAVLVDAIQSLDALPARGRPAARPDMRELIVSFGRSSYVVRYRWDEASGEVLIVLVWHGREERKETREGQEPA